ncbi:MAG: hypothetical protein CM1200mP20_05480 [Pseudomonadota bacterium]|nr:MAG: hypothetical protein CM1200mP20_05480 [Pseudomonadota bacterium]
MCLCPVGDRRCGAAGMLDSAVAVGAQRNPAGIRSVCDVSLSPLCRDDNGYRGALPLAPSAVQHHKEEKYHSTIRCAGEWGRFSFFCNPGKWVNEEVAKEVRVGIVAMLVFLLIFLVGSGVVFYRLSGTRWVSD